MSPTPQRNDIEVVLEGNSIYTEEKKNGKVLYRILKRAMDFIFALMGLVLLSPLFLIISILIKLEDPKGSIFFYQTRIGKDEKSFRMYKFRSMVSNAEELLEELLDQNEISGAMFKMKEDPRITKIGKFIRRTSIDELPQLWNVIRGEMSLVGPRPALPREVDQYSSYDKLRLSVIPGCTGLWQVSGRNKLSFYEMVELDLKYIEQRGIITDIKIILHTVRVLFGTKDAF
ncbi:Undecaprenyl phosphate N,N'-diacetylbacillosamine 1-phosphate transferase [Paenibacillus sp. GM2FR]|uniref:sugar transferase n=1 Tax=Paenibacillus TaxID=44249 RepID=UPI000CB92C32|nr:MULTISPECIES: sugar transferase [Paenibacillus]MEC0309232.1 sugar transferase [Paenibacillus lautus]PJN51381.1 Undecaprenyl phosphate N,N'-diacetylbacillosamine 1-phosphate transferase [Paenibacillus sp. GM2FR]